MTRVCVVRHGPFGSDPRVTKEAIALAGVPGVTVDVLARGSEPDAPHPATRVNVITISRTGPSERPVLLAVQALLFGLRTLGHVARARPRYDVVVIHSIPSWLLLLLWPARVLRPGTRLLLDHHEPEAEMLAEAGLPAAAAAAYRRVEALAIRTADGMVEVSDAMARRSASMGARRQVVVDNSPALHIALAERRREIRHDLAVFGSLIPRYDLLTLREALDTLGRPVSILQSGRGAARLEGNPSGGPWRTFPHLEPALLQAELRACAFGFVGLAPSAFTELVSPNRLFELASLGVPAVVARTPLIEDLLGPHAVYYDGGSVKSLRRALRTALDMDADARLAMGRGGQERVRDRTWERQSARFVRFCLDPAGPTTTSVLRNVTPGLKRVPADADTPFEGDRLRSHVAVSPRERG